MTALEVFGYLTDGVFVTLAATCVSVCVALIFIDSIGGKRK